MNLGINYLNCPQQWLLWPSKSGICFGVPRFGRRAYGFGVAPIFSSGFGSVQRSRLNPPLPHTTRRHGDDHDPFKKAHTLISCPCSCTESLRQRSMISSFTLNHSFIASYNPSGKTRRLLPSELTTDKALLTSR
jgi:hypothetical protein